MQKFVQNLGQKFVQKLGQNFAQKLGQKLGQKFVQKLGQQSGHQSGKQLGWQSGRLKSRTGIPTLFHANRKKVEIFWGTFWNLTFAVGPGTGRHLSGQLWGRSFFFFARPGMGYVSLFLFCRSTGPQRRSPIPRHAHLHSLPPGLSASWLPTSVDSLPPSGRRSSHCVGCRVVGLQVAGCWFVKSWEEVAAATEHWV